MGDNGKLWVASKTQGKVYRFNAAGTASDFATAPSVIDAYGLAVDPGGSAWVTSCQAVVQIDPAGAAGSPLALPEFSCPGGLAFDKQGNLWVVSEGTTDNGNLVQVTGASGTVQLNS